MDPEYEAFDTDIIIHINSALFTLMQNGVGIETGFKITGPTETWSDYIGDDVDLEAVKTYVYMKVRIAFDPPQNATVLNSYKDSCDEALWRMNVQVDSYH